MQLLLQVDLLLARYIASPAPIMPELCIKYHFTKIKSNGHKKNIGRP
jgi:hypothetical protein